MCHNRKQASVTDSSEIVDEQNAEVAKMRWEEGHCRNLKKGTGCECNGRVGCRVKKGMDRIEI